MHSSIIKRLTKSTYEYATHINELHIVHSAVRSTGITLATLSFESSIVYRQRLRWYGSRYSRKISYFSIADSRRSPVVRPTRVVVRKCILRGGNGRGMRVAGAAEPEVGRVGSLPRESAVGTVLDEAYFLAG